MTRPLFKTLDTVGDGTGSKDAGVDGSVTPVAFKYVPEHGDKTEIHRMLMHCQVSSVCDAGKYGDVAVLDTGVTVQIRNINDDAIVLDLSNGLPVKCNADWSRVCYDMKPDDFGPGNNFVNVRWTFAKSGAPVFLQDDQYFCVIINDNLAGLVEHVFTIQGKID